MALIYVEQLEEMDVNEMQTTHENEMKILNEIEKLATLYEMKRSDATELDKKLNEYVVHVKKHFANEEELMKKYDFPSYTMHKTAHDAFLEDLNHSSREWKNFGDYKKIINFIRKTPEWIVLHVNSVDAPTANYLAKKMQEE